MATTAQNSTQYDLQTTVGSELDLPYHGRVKALSFVYTQDGAGDATSTQTLIKLPAGKIMVLTKLSQIEVSAFGASRTLDVGFTAYNELDNTAVSADPDYFASDVDVSSATSFALNESATPTMAQYMESRDGIVVQAAVSGGTIPDGTTIKGFILYVNA